MRYRFCTSVSMLLLAAAAMAQVTPPASTGASDSWTSHPAASSSYATQLSSEAPRSKDHFKFKTRAEGGPMSQPPPSANDKAAVMGTDRAWQDGRPPVNCSLTPQDPKCH